MLVATVALPVLFLQTAKSPLKRYVLESGFSVLLPGPPKPLNMPNKPASVGTWALIVPGGGYVLTVTHLAPSRPSEAGWSTARKLENFLAGMKAGVDSKEFYRKPIKVDGHEGLEVKLTLGPNVIAVVRCAVVNDSIYEISTATSGKAKIPYVKEFLNSVKLPKSK